MFSLSHLAGAYVSIEIGKPHVRESQMAIQPLVLKGVSSPSMLKAGHTIFRTIQENLSDSGYFRLMEQEVFLEEPGEKGFEPYPKDPNGFIWKNWQILNTDYLLLGGYSFNNQVMTLDLYLYQVPLRRKVFQKQYTANMGLVGKLSHKICNDIIKVLTGKPGIFLTKIVAVRSMAGSKKELFMMDWNGKNKKQISFHKSTVVSPSWSKNGNHIAYTAFLYRKSTKRRGGHLLLYNRLSKTRRIISRRKGEHLGSDFLPGGKHILLSMFLGRGYMDVAKMSLVDGSITPITFGPNGSINVDPVVDSKGKRMFFLQIVEEG